MKELDRLNAVRVTPEDFSEAMDAIVMRPGEDLHFTILGLHAQDLDRGHAVFRRLDALIHAAASEQAPRWMSPVPTSRRMRDAMLKAAASVRLIMVGEEVRFPEDELFAEIRRLTSDEEASS